jgi:hemerythrin-like domain-containing protein
MSTDGEKKIARRIQKEANVGYQVALDALRNSREKINEAKKKSDEAAGEGAKERWADIAVRLIVADLKDDDIGHFSNITRNHQ